MPYFYRTLLGTMSLFLYLSFFFSCHSKKEISGFDTEAWKSDRNGCLGTRLAMKTQLDSISDKLKSMSNKDVLYVLGRPDKNELQRRNRKFFVYYLSPSPQCSNHDPKREEVTLRIRFNAVGLSNEVMIYD